MKDLLLFIKRDLKLFLIRSGYFYKILSLSVTLNILFVFIDEKIVSNGTSNIFSLLVCSTLLSGYLIQSDLNSRHLNQVIMTGKGPFIFLYSKILTVFLCLCLCLCTSFFSNIVFFNQYINLLQFSVYMLFCFIISLISIFSIFVLLNSKKPEALSLIITFPLTLSFIIYCSSLLSVTGNNLTHEIRILAGITLITLPLVVWGCGKSLTRI